MLPHSFYQQPSLELAPALLGCELVHTSPEGTIAGIIVETEAYREDDPASHSFRGKTKRTDVMFGPAGHAYIYFTYGMHHCFNVVASDDGHGEAVLIRALEPTQGVDLMEQRRRTTDRRNLCSGPAKLVQALGLQPAQNGASLTTKQLHIRPRTTIPKIATTPRIGIRLAAEQPWRFIVANSPYITSSKFNKTALPWKDEA